MEKYLEASEYIDWQDNDVLKKAQQLAQSAQQAQESQAGQSHQLAVAKVCFEYVRDEIKHSSDYKLNPVTCKASDELQHGTGYCYAKSHLLAALLRANNIPAGLCYQRLTIGGDKPPFCLHGLNAIYLDDFGWYRVDPRGNKAGVEAEFCPPLEKLAFPIVTKGEDDLPEIWHQPLPVIVNALQMDKDYQYALEHLPDIPLIAN